MIKDPEFSRVLKNSSLKVTQKKQSIAIDLAAKKTPNLINSEMDNSPANPLIALRRVPGWTLGAQYLQVGSEYHLLEPKKLART